ncbi:uncharacterized protein TRUGW13939_06806 [Talaromyces rugulosus]|uniref:C2H2-type domain-containing protein n=1 Tax=Talaromyces rugulosus TaxID=121627 RepID=A0A7H8R0U0_TALRU|nr:uncharacterized protein TRUGW13939_06806 [Talaromyces rugulosus]QKX59666.1 hypothetical protein TRUGW13939_06806 [Talaromyces rugulosus]
MQPLRLGPHDLLEYDARYGVLICRECQYAIQKSALPSHLLRHKIYRGERQRLLSSIAQLDVLESENVTLPAPTSPPIDLLPIISGYRCMIAGCENLCASSKRMKRHQSEAHELPNSPSYARPAKLQTFFRGTKLRYFEVACSMAVNSPKKPLMATFENDQTHDKRAHRQLPPYVNTAATLSLSPSTGSTPNGLDLEALAYLHHFVTRTSSTLPVAENSELSGSYWQTNIVIQALEHQWLTCGLLAISAGHSIVLSVEAPTKEVHRKRYIQFLAEFSAGREHMIRIKEANMEKETVEIAMKLGFILQCVQGVLAGPESVLSKKSFCESAATFDMEYFMQTVPKFLVSHPGVHPSEARSEHKATQNDPFPQATTIFKTGVSRSPDNISMFSICDDQPSVINHLRTLPSRMAEVFGKPENVQDALATLSAIAVLVECCETSFASNTVETAWRCMARWLIKVPDHFNHMVSQNSPVSLVVVAYWSAFLVKRVEDSGCWFLMGSAKTILLQVVEHLSTHGYATKSLVESLLP